MNKALELWDLFRIINKRKWLVIFTIFLVVTLGILYSIYLVEPEYESSTTLMVNSSKALTLEGSDPAVDISSINLSQRLVVTYKEIVKSRVVLGQVSDTLGLGFNYKMMLSMVDVALVENTELLKIKVVDIDPVRAQQITEQLSIAFIAEIQRILKVDNVEIVDPPIAEYRPTNDRSIMNIAISAVAGLMIGLFIAFFLEYINRNISTEADITKYLNMNLIGTIPEYSKEMRRGV